jgi:hypothetical protein
MEMRVYSDNQNYWRQAKFRPPKNENSKTSSKTPSSHFLIQNMPKQAKERSKRKATSSINRMVPAKPTSIPKTTVTRIKVKKFVHPDDIDKSSSPEQEEIVVPTPEPILDVSTLDHTLRTSCPLDETPVLEDTTYYKLTEFAYHPFHVMTSKKVERAAVQQKTEFEWMSGMATLCAKSIAIKNQLKIPVEDTEGWKKVEQRIERWMREKKTEIIVNLVLQYKKVAGDNDNSSEDEGPPLKKVFLV